MGNKSKRLKNTNRALYKVMFFFLALFLILIINNARFLLVESSNLIINPYNSRLSEIEEEIVRGTIYDKDMIPIAQSVASNGEYSRVYPYGNLFSHVVGYATRGKTGLERLCNINLLQNDDSLFTGIVNDITKRKTTGNSVVTTLDLELQQKADELLGDNKGAIIALEPSTGKILCMVSKPDFDPNYINEDWEKLDADEDSPFYNRATQGLYAPGSTFKILTAMEYLLEYDAHDFSYTCDGDAIFGERVIKCYNSTAHGEVDLKEAFAVSCNTSFAKIGKEIDIDGLNNLANQFLFNQALPYDMSYSVSDFNLNSNSDESMVVETVIGQGETLISPLHNALITATIANGGIMMKPYLIDSIINKDGEIVEKRLPVMYKQVLEPEYTTTLTDYMIEVVNSGTGKNSAIEGVTIAAKTGTAENNSGADHAWYVGFAPAEAPTIAIAIIVENSGTSGEISVPIARELFDGFFAN